jgi:HEAT repeat protein
MTRNKALLALALLTLACSGDPNDPRTWAKKLSNLREQDEALTRIANMDVEKARVVVPELLALYKETKSPAHLQALSRYKDERTTAVMIEALDYTDEDFDRAVIAAGVLGEMKAASAVDKLVEGADKQLPIKSRANAAKLASIRALVKIGDKKAVPALTKILTTSADEQDFLLNQRAALGLAELRAPEAIPALIKGLFMTGRGTDIFQECRLALVRIGQPAIDPVIELFQGKNAEIKEMAVKQQFRPGIIQYKAAYLLGDLRAAKAVSLMTRYLGGKPQGDDPDEHTAVIIALGQIGNRDAVDALIAVLNDKKGEPKHRFSAADALYMAGDQRALPALFEIAKSGDLVVEGQKTALLRANAAVDYSRLAGAAHFAAFKALADKQTELQGPFAEAVDRLQVAKDCNDNLACYGKTLADPAWQRAEKAAFAIAFSGDKDGVPLLLGALKPLAALPQDRYPVHQALLFALARLGDKTCKACEQKLVEQIERDEKAVRLPGARGLLAETRVTLAVLQNNEPGAGAARAVATAAPTEGAAPAGKAKGKGKGKKVASRKGKRR